MMKRLYFILVFCLVAAESKSQHKESSCEQDSLCIKNIDLIEGSTYCYIPSDSALFITKDEEFRKHGCKSNEKIDFDKYNYLLVYINASGCKQHKVKLYLDKNLHTNENVLHINITQFGYCAMSTHSFHSYVVSKEDCKLSPQIVKTIKIVDRRANADSIR